MPTPNTSSPIISTTLTGNNFIDSLIEGHRWASTFITYSFPGSSSSWSQDPIFGYGPSTDTQREPWSPSFSPLTSSDQTYFNVALQQWANVANIQFGLIPEFSTNVGDIRVAYTSMNPGVQAYTYTLQDGYANAGDIWVNSTGTSASQEWVPGRYPFLAIMHEIGHALGLKHPFEGSPTLPVSWDSQSKTIMSYSAIAGDTHSFFSFDPTTPMPLDILAIQYLYGPNTTYHSGDDTYLFDDTQTYHETIWDSGGTNDWIEYNGSQDSTIDLREGYGSYIGHPVYAEDGTTVNHIPNVWIAYNTVIENASGGSGNDTLVGNDANNILIGGNGNDTLIGGAGNDILRPGYGSSVLDGGSGIDTVLVGLQRNNFTLSKDSSGYTLVANANPDIQATLTNIERLEFDDIKLALDLDGHAGQVAKLLGAVFGASTVTNKEYTGIGLTEADNGLSYEQLGEVAIHATGKQNYDEIVTLLWNNLFGSLPSETEKSPYINLLDTGKMSVGALAVLAADSSFNTENINLTGLTQTGIAFV